ncbi:MAG: NTP transferase domain-containing protein [Actinobacteria bacterium]|nr:NTP transferase domain-containing protein [Actinomycetota bacterium]
MTEGRGGHVPEVAGLLLTGGASRRMGVDKALLEVDGLSLAQRTANVLAAVVAPALEVGPGRTTLPAVEEEPAGEGPLVAAAAGFRALAERGHVGPVIVVATDLPRLSVAVVQALASHSSAGSVVPLVAGRPQWLAARWSPRAVGRAPALVRGGERRMQALADDVDDADDVEWLDASDWAGDLIDVDTPADLRHAGLVPVVGGNGDG